MRTTTSSPSIRNSAKPQSVGRQTDFTITKQGDGRFFAKSPTLGTLIGSAEQVSTAIRTIAKLRTAGFNVSNLSISPAGIGKVSIRIPTLSEAPLSGTPEEVLRGANTVRASQRATKSSRQPQGVTSSQTANPYRVDLSGKSPIVSINDMLRPAFQLPTRARDKYDRLLNPTPEEKQQQWEADKRKPGTRAYTRDQINKSLPTATTVQKDIVYNFLDKASGSTISPSLFQRAKQLASEGKWNLMRSPSDVANELPFTMADYVVARRNYEGGAKDASVAAKHDWTPETENVDEPNIPAHGSRIPFEVARRVLASKLKFDPNDPKFGRFVQSFWKLSGDTRTVEDVPKLSAYKQLLSDSASDNPFATYASASANALRIAPATLQDTAAKAMGFHEGEVLDMPEVQDDPVGKIGSTVYQAAKYSIPGAAPFVVGSDVAGMIGHAADVGPIRAFSDTVNGILQSAYFWDPSIDGYEKAGRFMNALMLGYGIKHGYTKAGEIIDRASVVNELSKKLNVSLLAANKLLLDAEDHAQRYIAALDKPTKPGSEIAGGSTKPTTDRAPGQGSGFVRFPSRKIADVGLGDIAKSPSSGKPIAEISPGRGPGGPPKVVETNIPRASQSGGSSVFGPPTEELGLYYRPGRTGVDHDTLVRALERGQSMLAFDPSPNADWGKMMIGAFGERIAPDLPWLYEQATRLNQAFNRVRGGERFGQPVNPTVTRGHAWAADPRNPLLLSNRSSIPAGSSYELQLQRAMGDYPGFRRVKKGTDGIIDHLADGFGEHYERLSPEFKDSVKGWFMGANRLANVLANRFGVSIEQAAAVIANLSPTKEWAQNFSLAERTLRIYRDQQSFKWDSAMDDVANRRLQRLVNGTEYQRDVAASLISLRNKRLGDLNTPRDKALWIRMFDEAHNPRSYRDLHPSGDLLDFVPNKDGTERRIAWGPDVLGENAIRAIESRSLAQLSASPGQGLKVRNFYNNIVAPLDPRFATVDTHVVGAGLNRMITAKSAEAMHTFDPRFELYSPESGAHGTYPLYHAALEQKALDYGLLPNELGSIVWSGQKSMFPPGIRTRVNKDLVDQDWRGADQNRWSLKQARDAIFEKWPYKPLPWQRFDMPDAKP
jgi:hypothetical protein